MDSRKPEKTLSKHPAKSSRKKKKMPINLLRKQRREQRNANPRIKKSKRKKHKPKVLNTEQEALLYATEIELKKILSETELLSDIPYDCTPEELLGEIAIAKDNATIIYVQREGLSTLTIVLHQPKPTIANLKRTIEKTARVQLNRELRERNEESQRRRNPQETAIKNAETEEHKINKFDEQVAAPLLTPQHNTISNEQAAITNVESTGELVYSTARSGHNHRPNVSWRFLWRAYALYNVDKKLLIDDSDGRKLLSDFGIENTTTLRFCNRERYCGRKRQ